MTRTAHEERSTLWSGWSVTEVVDEVVEADGVLLHRAGLSAEGPGGVVATGAAADVDGPALDRAWFELVERASVMEAIAGPDRFVVRGLDGVQQGSMPRELVFPVSDAPERRQFSKSNGVALGRDWPSACRHAMLELIERDRLIRSWCGHGAPVPVGLNDHTLDAASSYDWRAVRVPAAVGAWDEGIEVVMVVGFPVDPSVPLLRGSAAGEVLDTAVARAVRECLQGLAFLWDEPLPTEAPQLVPSPLYHLDWFLRPESHELLRSWLWGEHTRVHPAMSPTESSSATVTWADLTPVTAGDRFRVARALCDAAVPLVFGEGPAWLMESLPAELQTHPFA